MKTPEPVQFGLHKKTDYLLKLVPCRTLRPGAGFVGRLRGRSRALITAMRCLLGLAQPLHRIELEPVHHAEGVESTFPANRRHHALAWLGSGEATEL